MGTRRSASRHSNDLRAFLCLVAAATPRAHHRFRLEPPDCVSREVLKGVVDDVCGETSEEELCDVLLAVVLVDVLDSRCPCAEDPQTYALRPDFASSAAIRELLSPGNAQTLSVIPTAFPGEDSTMGFSPASSVICSAVKEDDCRARC